jgi:transcription initiation factor TFIIE subunit beta
MRLAELRESYPLAKEAVEDFAKTEPKQDREVLVLRGKDQSAKMVFWNEFRGEQAKGPDDGE